jgi:hypothetical protein
MSPALLAALQASLANPAKEWVVFGVAPSLDDDGYGTITYQLQSIPCGVTIVASREVSAGDDFIRLFIKGFAYTTGDVGLITQIAAMAVPAAAEAEADLIARL